MLVDELAAALAWPLDRVQAALEHADAHPALVGPLTLRRTAPHTYTVGPRQRCFPDNTLATLNPVRGRWRRMPKKKMWVEYDDGSDLTKSQKKPGDYSPLTREDGTNKLGQVTLSDIDEDDEEDPQVVYVYTTDPSEPDRPLAPAEPWLSEREMEMLRDLIILGVTAAVKAKPHVTRWLEQAAPVVRSTWNRFRSRETGGPATRAEHAAAAEAAPPPEAQEVVAALEAYRASMSTEEARNRFLAALVTRLYSEEQLRILREARIEDVDGLLELDSMVEPLTAEQLRSAITALLEENPSLVGDGGQAELAKILGTNRREAARVPLAGEPSAEPLRTDRGM